jgi:hypothetical protein
VIERRERRRRDGSSLQGIDPATGNVAVVGVPATGPADMEFVDGKLWVLSRNDGSAVAVAPRT